MRRCIGLDVHREFAEVAIWEDGIVRSAGRIETTPEALRLFAESLCHHDEVALEATCNTNAIARLLERHVGRVVVSNPLKTRAIAEGERPGFCVCMIRKGGSCPRRRSRMS